METRTRTFAPNKLLAAFIVAVVAAIAGCLGLVACGSSNPKGTLEVTTAFQSSYEDNTYGVGDPLITDGAAVTFTPEKGNPETVAVTADMVTDFTTALPGEHTLKVTYKGATAVFNYKVIATNETTDFAYHFERPDNQTPVDDADILGRNDNRIVIDSLVAMNAEEVVVPAYINGFPVYTVGQGAFESSAVKKVTLPKTLRNIDDHAFLNCYDLEEINFPSKLVRIGNAAFGTTALKTLELPASLAIIENHAFAFNDSFTQVTVPSTVRLLGQGIFAQCNNLTSVSLPFPGSDVTSKKTAAFLLTEDDKMSTLPTTLTSIEYTGNMTVATQGLFKDARYVKTITLPKTVVDAEADAFTGSLWLNSQSGVVTVGGGVVVAYKGASSSVSLPANTVAIGDEAFANSSVSDVELPTTLKTIGTKAFYGCSNLTELELPAAIQEIRASAFENSALTDVNVPSKLTKIGDRVFRNTMITEFYASDALTEIGERAFENCPLENVTLKEGLIYIGGRAFAGTVLKQATLPDSLTEIGSGIFANCKLNSLTVPFIGETLYEPQTLSFFFADTASQYNSGIPTSLTSVAVTQATNLAAYAFANITTRIDSEGDIHAFDTYDSSSFLTVRLDNVLSLPNYAFYSSFIHNLNVPDELTSIGNYAFALSTVVNANFEKLETLGTGAFQSCQKLQTVSFGTALSKIPEDAFNNSTLTSISGIDNVTEIGANAFEDATALSSISLPSVKTIGGLAFSDSNISSVTFGSATETIGAFAFANTKIKTATLPDTVTSLGHGIFNGTALTSLTLPFIGADARTPSVLGYMFSNSASPTSNTSVPATLTKVEVTTATEIATGAFQSIGARKRYLNSIDPLGFDETDSSTYLTVNLKAVTTVPENAFNSSFVGKVTLFDDVTSIEESAFNASKLFSVNIPSKLETIGESAFKSTLLTSVSLPLSIYNIGAYAFQNCTYLETLIFATPEATSSYTVDFSIGNSAFAGNTSLTSVELPVYLYSLGEYAFDGCTKLADLTFAERNFNSNTMAIQSYTFRNTALTTVTLPSYVTILNSYSFYNCSDLNHIISNASSLYLCSYVVSTVSRSGSTVQNLTTLTYEGLDSYSSSSSGFTYRGLNSNITNGMLMDGNTAVRYLGSAKSYVMSENVTAFRQYAFANTSLTGITFASGVTTFYSGMFAGTDLTSVTFRNVPKTSNGYTMYMYELYGFGSSSYLVNAGVSLSTVTFNGGSTYTTVPTGFFSGLATLTTATIGEGYTISSSMFTDCGKLTTLTLPYTTSSNHVRYYLGTTSNTSNSPKPTNITVLGSNNYSTFYISTSSFGSNLEITLGEKITNVYSLAFLEDTATLNIQNAGSVLTTSSASYPSFTGSLRIVVPATLLDSYKASNSWSIFANNIVSA